jgi:hypothetical protein
MVIIEPVKRVFEAANEEQSRNKRGGAVGDSE